MEAEEELVNYQPRIMKLMMMNWIGDFLKSHFTLNHKPLLTVCLIFFVHQWPLFLDLIFTWRLLSLDFYKSDTYKETVPNVHGSGSNRTKEDFACLVSFLSLVSEEVAR